MTHLATYGLAFVVVVWSLAAVFLAPGRARGIIAAGCFGLCALLILAMALLPTLLFDSTTYFGDLWTALEAANKSAGGLASSRDYFSPIGPVYDWMFRLVLLFRPLSATVVASASAIFALLTVGLACAMLPGRISTLALALTCLIAVATILSPREVDQMFHATSASWLAPYNRWAWGLLLPVVMMLCTPYDRLRPVGALALGLALALLILLKVTYGLAALGLLAVSVVLCPRRLPEGLMALVGLLATLGLAEILSHQVLSHFADLRTTAGLDANGLRIGKLVQQTGEMLFWAGLALAVLLLSARSATPGTGYWHRILPVLLICTAAAMANVILMQNHYGSGSPVYLLLLLIAAEWTGLLRPEGAPARDMPLDGPRQPGPDSKGLLLLLLLLVLPQPLADAGHVAAQYIQHARFPDDATRSVTARGDMIVHERWLRDDPCTISTCRDYRRLLTGAAALRALGADRPEAGRVLALNFANPFPFVLARPSPTAAPIWLHEGRSFSAESFIPADRLFGDVGYVIHARGEANGEALYRIYAGHIAEHFTEAARLDDWIVYVRR